jgi:hypothetical protein
MLDHCEGSIFEARVLCVNENAMAYLTNRDLYRELNGDIVVIKYL